MSEVIVAEKPKYPKHDWMLKERAGNEGKGKRPYTGPNTGRVYSCKRENCIAVWVTSHRGVSRPEPKGCNGE